VVAALAVRNDPSARYRDSEAIAAKTCSRESSNGRKLKSCLVSTTVCEGSDAEAMRLEARICDANASADARALATANAEFFMRGSADSSEPKSFAREMLESAIRMARSEQLCVLFLDAGAELNATNEWRESALHLAACNGQLSVVEMLLERGATFDEPDRGGLTPAERARRSGHSEIFKVVFSHKLGNYSSRNVLPLACMIVIRCCIVAASQLDRPSA
jgi:hypothetical protein